MFYTTRKGITGKMSPDNVARFLSTYEKAARIVNPVLPHLHPHLFRHARTMHLYQAGMPLPLVSEWLGHSQLETSLIYAYADTEMKRAVADKVINAKNSVFTNEKFRYQDDEETIKRLYGLA
ncbi:tyrosine-type recombinase/integrase [Schnuerera ultunensis]|uniref:tyrosine-type recombinase/integrase n=1 Tax=Schnuerera ultunensis TaxID=45497 RepID=UPI000407B055|nr:tyrosine-type recombinase/integrase [Schnuerera ultunensis]